LWWVDRNRGCKVGQKGMNPGLRRGLRGSMWGTWGEKKQWGKGGKRKEKTEVNPVYAKTKKKGLHLYGRLRVLDDKRSPKRAKGGLELNHRFKQVATKDNHLRRGHELRKNQKKPNNRPVGWGVWGLRSDTRTGKTTYGYSR